MEILLGILAVIAFLFWAPSAVEMALGYLRVPLLEKVDPLPEAECPRLSIVVPACNEEETIEPAMRSLLRLDYPGLEIIAVNDRSTDHTGAILARLASEDSRLRVIDLKSLPDGWLGKNHALQVGSDAAAGEWLLFTDADVVYAPDALRRVMALALARGCDHLVAMPRLLLHGFGERAFVSFFMVIFSFRFRTWQASWRSGWGYVGVGAFNLVRAASYREMGGHHALRLEVGDDIKLGKLLKRHGCRQLMADAGELIRVRWVVGLRGAVHGLSKNAFAGVGYSWPAAVSSSLLMIWGCVWPYAGLFFGSVADRLLCAAAVLSTLLAAWTLRREHGASPLYALTWPAAALLFAYIIVRSGVLATRQRGIYWRGTFYRLDELKRNQA